MTSHNSGTTGSSSSSQDGAFGCNQRNLYNFRFTFETILTSSRLKTMRSGSFLEADPNPEDRDDQSLTESVANFHEEFGRTYHAYRAGSYPYPNDSIEIQRMDMQYHLFNQMMGRLFFAPWTKKRPPTHVLDVATGTGAWAIDFGDRFPTAVVQGNDLSPIQPDIVPPNVHFFVEDASEEWSASERYDYVHASMCLGSFENFKSQILQQAYDNLLPGGWMESHEFNPCVFCDDDTLTEQSPLYRWAEELIEASRIANRPLLIAPLMKQWFIDVGFVDVQEFVFRLPLNPWPKDLYYKELGRRWEVVFSEGLSAYSYSLLNRIYGKSQEEIEVELVDVRKNVNDIRTHAYHRFHVVIGRKPHAHEMLGKSVDTPMSG